MKYRLYRVGHSTTGEARHVDAARALHAAVKHALDECYRMGGPAEFPLDRLRERFIDAFDGTACADSREEDECRDAGTSIVERYHAARIEDLPLVAEVDVPIRGEIGGWLFDAHANRREERTDDSIAFIILTTARRPPTEGPSQDDLRTGILQLVAEDREHRPVEVELHALRSGRVYDATKPPRELEGIVDRVSALAQVINETPSDAAVRGKHCRWCHARGVCPEWTDQ
jgi:hypothetical protein